MVQTRSKSGPVENPASSQALRGNNGSVEDSSCGTISEAPQRLTRGDALPISDGVWLPGDQKALKNPGAMGIRDPMKVDALPDNEKSGRKNENEIAAEIERLKKEQKKVQMRTKLHCLRKHKAWGFVENISEQKSYTQKLTLKRAKKVCDSNVYWEESQRTLNEYISQVNFVFQTKPLTYASEKAKCFHTAVFLGSIF